MSGNWITAPKIPVTILPRHPNATASSIGGWLFLCPGAPVSLLNSCLQAKRGKIALWPAENRFFAGRNGKKRVLACKGHSNPPCWTVNENGAGMLPTPFRFGQSGFEPPTPWSRTKCASPCATTRFGKTLFNIWFLTDRVNKTRAGRRKTSSRPAQDRRMPAAGRLKTGLPLRNTAHAHSFY